MLKGQFARRAMELGGWPVRSCSAVVVAHTPYKREVVGSRPTRTTISESAPAPPGLWLSKTRLIHAMRKIDPDLAHMIESLAPVYLVKKERDIDTET